VWALTEVMLAHQKPEPNPEPVTIPSTVTAFKRQRA
jgi:hypothetical protein